MNEPNLDQPHALPHVDSVTTSTAIEVKSPTAYGSIGAKSHQRTRNHKRALLDKRRAERKAAQ